MPKPVQYHEGQFPPASLNWPQLIAHIGPANAAVARYDGTLSAVPNASVLLSPLMTQEAVLSSRIEGTQATFGEVLEYEAGQDSSKFSPERKEDIGEVLNYRQAMHTALDMLKELPLCQRVIKRAHAVLLQDVRGQGRSPGEYRKGPNWIGPPGCSIEEARFVPISAEKLPAAMSRWEAYIHEDAPDKLIQLALLHAEFEALHPFLDGNGRLGRMFVPLFMAQTGLIASPMFYISAYCEARRDEYYERLLAVSQGHDWTGWCSFFLQAIQAQAEENQRKAKAILNLYESLKHRFAELSRSQYAINALDWLFQRPIFKSTDFITNPSIPDPTSKRILKILKEKDIVTELIPGGGRRAAVLALPSLLQVAEQGEDFVDHE